MNAQVDETAVKGLYQQLLDSWNRHSADDFAACFTEDGSSAGFDGSQMNGRSEIQSTLAKIFADHVTARISASCVRYVYWRLKWRCCGQ